MATEKKKFQSPVGACLKKLISDPVSWKRRRCKEHRFFFVTERTQLNAASACVVSQKIATECGIAFSETRLFLENHSLEFHEI